MAVDGIEREAQVLAIFRQLLNAPALGAEQNFFEAGGSSLLAARLSARLRSSGVLDVATSAIFAAPTARALNRYAATLAAASNVAGDDPSVATTPGDAGETRALERGARQRAVFARLRPAASEKLP